MAQQIPSTEYLVVKPVSNGGGVGEALAELGEVEPVEGADLLLLRLHGDPPDLEAARTQLLDDTEGVAWAEPVFLDEHREPHLPTGDVTLRFTRNLSEEELEAFANEHGLHLMKRNEFVPEQATFAPADPRRLSLADVVRELAAAPGVKSAWANTMSRYRRS
jgi:hypothetical protein